MKTLIAVVTCHARRRQADAQFHSWAQGCPYPVRFFLGEGDFEEDVRDVLLPVDDSYAGLPAKVKAVMQWARAEGYGAVLKMDDDAYLVPYRMDIRHWRNFDYAGNFRMRNGPYPYDYASGFTYWLSGRGLDLVADAALTEDTMEDRWVGNVMGSARPLVRALDEKRFCCTYPAGIDEAKFLWGSPIGKTNISFAQYPAEKFPALQYWYERAFTGAHSVHS